MDYLSEQKGWGSSSVGLQDGSHLCLSAPELVLPETHWLTQSKVQRDMPIGMTNICGASGWSQKVLDLAGKCLERWLEPQL